MTAQYRCRHVVEAMRWVDTPECREEMSRWFEGHNDQFVTRGSVARVIFGDDVCDVEEGTWILRMGDDWVAMDDEMFRVEYDQVTP